MLAKFQHLIDGLCFCQILVSSQVYINKLVFSSKLAASCNGLLYVFTRITIKLFLSRIMSKITDELSQQECKGDDL